MDVSELTVRLLILFIPGILATTVYRLYQNRDELNNRDYLVNVFLTAFVLYTITYLIFKLFGNNTVFFEALLNSNIKINFVEILTASIISILVGYAEAKIVNSGWLYRKDNKITTRTGHSSVWDELFDNQNKGFDGYIYISFLDRNLVYGGSVEKYSMTYSGRKELYLSNVVVYDSKTRQEFQYELDGLYIQIHENENVIIEVTKGEEEEENGKKKPKSKNNK